MSGTSLPVLLLSCINEMFEETPIGCLNTFSKNVTIIRATMMEGVIPKSLRWNKYVDLGHAKGYGHSETPPCTKSYFSLILAIESLKRLIRPVLPGPIATAKEHHPVKGYNCALW